jgi:hypothetical protein
VADFALIAENDVSAIATSLPEAVLFFVHVEATFAPLLYRMSNNLEYAAVVAQSAGVA